MDVKMFDVRGNQVNRTFWLVGGQERVSERRFLSWVLKRNMLRSRDQF